MNLNEAINSIVKEFGSGSYFDTHAVIDALHKHPYHEIYMHSFPENCNVNQYHAIIGKKIGSLQNVTPVLIDGQPVKIKSFSIYEKIEDNQLWRIKNE